MELPGAKLERLRDALDHVNALQDFETLKCRDVMSLADSTDQGSVSTP